MEASAQGHVGLVRALLKWRPDVNATNKVYRSCMLMYMCQSSVYNGLIFGRMDLLLYCKHAPAISGVLHSCSWTKEQMSTSVGL